MRTVRFGIVGLGAIAHQFARVLNTASGGALAAVAARDVERAERFKTQYGAGRAYGSYQALAEDPDVDAVYIALTHNFHYEMARLCLEHGKHVLCEKPCCLRAAEVRELAALAAASKLTLMEAMWTRCLPAFQQARVWVRDGRIGPVCLIQAAFCFNAPRDPEKRLFNPALAGGALLDVGVYPIEFAMGILDEHPVQVEGVCHLCDTGVDDCTTLSLRFPGGAVAALACGLVGAASTDATVVGADGRIVVYDFFGTKKCALFDRENRPVETFERSVTDGFIYEIDHFAGLVRAGALESPLIPLRDTLACAEVFDRLRTPRALPDA
ncbi:MAG: Gfo/Idh/MocA family oxidoreductase [Lentisphaeria bacterium]